ncbi:MAG TPA: hypothetical protein VFW13_08100 [Phenylobacterium sp.]|nr:hypothetical protein [Phenylobacterium sp.]
MGADPVIGMGTPGNRLVPVGAQMSTLTLDWIFEARDGQRVDPGARRDLEAYFGVEAGGLTGAAGASVDAASGFASGAELAVAAVFVLVPVVAACPDQAMDARCFGEAFR